MIIGEKQKILIVDDKPENLYSLEYILKEVDVEVIKAISGNEALLKALEHEFALAILDIQMPEMDGYELAEIMRGDDSLKNIPIIFLSAIYSDDFHIFKGYSAGAVDFITKPYNPEIFLNKVKVFVEIAKQKENLVDRNNELKEIMAQLIQSEKLSILGELAAGIFHELKQPLNAIKIINQSILRSIKKNKFDIGEIENDLKDVISCANKMNEIIEHMRIFSRHSKNDASEIIETIELNDPIKMALKFVEQQLKDHDIKIKKEFSSDLPKIKGNPTRLEQVFLNLITNAKGSLENCQKLDKEIEIRTYQVDMNAVTVEIKDNGAGIAKDIIDKIFEPFFTTKGPDKGTGLGLSISKKIIEAEFKGKIEVESTVGEGSTFKVILSA